MIRYLNSFMRHWRLYRLFPGECYGCFRGVYSSFEEALAAAPKTKKTGYDHHELAQWYLEELDDEIKDFDYPVMFHLQKLLPLGPKVLDFGGNIGIHYLQYKKYVPFIEQSQWVVFELPEMVEAAQQKVNEPGLSFTADFEADFEADIFLASGSLQYIGDVKSLLQRFQSLPKHLLINRLPLYPGEQFVTLQNGGQVFYPQYVFNETEFLQGLNDLGYTLRDRWVDRIDGCIVPFHPKRSIAHYSGLYLSR
ncbi:MAG: methyltransferase, TIGR04325 family [Salibacteraceae bacterium]